MAERRIFLLDQPIVMVRPVIIKIRSCHVYSQILLDKLGKEAGQ